MARDRPKTSIPLSHIKNGRQRNKLDSLCRTYRDLADQATALDIAKKSVMDDIKSIAGDIEADRVTGDGWNLIRVHRVNKQIRAEKLVDQGVDLRVIERATVVQETSYFTVTQAT